MDLMHTLVGVVDKQQRIQESRLSPRNGLTKFVKLVKPFDGSSTDPIKAEEWIEEIEKAYKAQGVMEEQKVPFAAFLLKGTANDWWKSEENLMEQPITWLKFKRIAFANKCNESFTPYKKVVKQ